ncbi:hypothetical protein AX16_006905 [Volvariella volvacea WC 439]|nr:hypothetical protein AX16_006905 [Volvariella volvacea WC 439]
MQSYLQSLAAVYLLANAGVARAQTASTLPPPGQPQHTGTPGAFEIIGDSLVSAQQLFLGTPDKVFFVDKVENNPTQINGHPVWASEWGMESNAQRPMNAITNSFCAGGNVLGNGTWINVGGNQAVTYGGDPAPSQDGGPPYYNPDGRRSLLTPCDDGNCDWILSPYASDQRWYPTLETLEDGSIMIVGGCRWGGYVNDAGQDNPTYEFFPPRGEIVRLPILERTLPANLYPLIWLLPSGRLFIQSNWATVLYDYRTQTETPLDDVPDAVRVYPASAGTAMLPLTPQNNYTATLLFCGGSNVAPNRWLQQDFIASTYPASASCVQITPDHSSSYVQDDAFPEARSMANFIILPDGKILNLNGARLGTAGYGNTSWSIGQSFADEPVMVPTLYDPDAPAGSRWSRDGWQASTVPRMYHSAATLLADGSVLVSGSNPNSDVNVGPDVIYPTEYRTERLYPLYYDQRRPEPEGLLSQLSYGGPSFDVTLDAEDLFNNVDNAKTAKVVVLRTGFSTHSMNMGQRYLQLNSTYTAYQSNNTAVLHVNQMPPNPALYAPGPALLFVVVNGVPSVGVQVMVGSGQIEEQRTLAVPDLPASVLVPASNQNADSSGGSNGNNSSAGLRTVSGGQGVVTGVVVAVLTTLAAWFSS